MQPVFDKPMIVKKTEKGVGNGFTYTDINLIIKQLVVSIDSRIYNFIDSIYPGVERSDICFELKQYGMTDYRFYVTIENKSVYLWQYKSLPEWAR